MLTFFRAYFKKLPPKNNKNNNENNSLYELDQ